MLVFIKIVLGKFPRIGFLNGRHQACGVSRAAQQMQGLHQAILFGLGQQDDGTSVLARHEQRIARVADRIHIARELGP